MFLFQVITRITIPLSSHSMLKKLAGNTSGSFVNTLCDTEMREWGELKSHISSSCLSISIHTGISAAIVSSAQPLFLSPQPLF